MLRIFNVPPWNIRETIRILKETVQMFYFTAFPPRNMIFSEKNAARHVFFKDPSAPIEADTCVHLGHDHFEADGE